MDCRPGSDFLDRQARISDRWTLPVWFFLFVAFSGMAALLVQVDPNGPRTVLGEASVAGFCLSTLIVVMWNFVRPAGWYAATGAFICLFYRPPDWSGTTSVCAIIGLYFTLLLSTRNPLTLGHLISVWACCALITGYGWLTDSVSQTSGLAIAVLALQPVLLLISNGLFRLLFPSLQPKAQERS